MQTVSGDGVIEPVSGLQGVLPEWGRGTEQAGQAAPGARCGPAASPTRGRADGPAGGHGGPDSPHNRPERPREREDAVTSSGCKGVLAICDRRLPIGGGGAAWLRRGMLAAGMLHPERWHRLPACGSRARCPCHGDSRLPIRDLRLQAERRPASAGRPQPSPTGSGSRGGRWGGVSGGGGRRSSGRRGASGRRRGRGRCGRRG